MAGDSWTATGPAFRSTSSTRRPVRTFVLVGVADGVPAASAVAVYLVSALVLRATFGYPFPLLPWPPGSPPSTSSNGRCNGGPVTRSSSGSDRVRRQRVRALAMSALARVGRPSSTSRSATTHCWRRSAWRRSVWRSPASHGSVAAMRGQPVPDSGMARILGLARRPVPVPVSHDICDAGAGVVRPEVQWTAGAGDRSGARDRDSAVVRGHHPTRCRALRRSSPNRPPGWSRWSWRCSPCRPC